MSTAIAIEGVTKRFGSVVAVDGLGLRVPRGSLYGFMLMGLGWPCGLASPAWQVVRSDETGRLALHQQGGPHHPDRDGHRLDRRQDLPHRPADAGQAAQFRRAGPLGDGKMSWKR